MKTKQEPADLRAWPGLWQGRCGTGMGRESVQALPLDLMDQTAFDGTTDRGTTHGASRVESMLRIHSRGCVPLLRLVQACCLGKKRLSGPLELPILRFSVATERSRGLEGGPFAEGHRLFQRY